MLLYMSEKMVLRKKKMFYIYAKKNYGKNIISYIFKKKYVFKHL